MIESIVKIWAKYDYVFLNGLWGTLWLAFVTVLFGTILGTLVALLRLSRCKVFQALTGAYIEVLRGTPILLQLYFFWLLLPKVLPFKVSDTACIIVALVINSSSYVAEVIRAGIQAVDKGQMEAAKSLGLSNKNAMRYVILPQAVKNILPALGNEFVVMVKETSLASDILCWRADDSTRQCSLLHSGDSVLDDRRYHLFYPEFYSDQDLKGCREEAAGQ